MAKVKVPTEYELLQQELNHTINEVKIAESNFNYADAKFFDIANEELTIASVWTILNGKIHSCTVMHLNKHTQRRN